MDFRLLNYPIQDYKIPTDIVDGAGWVLVVFFDSSKDIGSQKRKFYPLHGG